MSSTFEDGGRTDEMKRAKKNFNIQLSKSIDEEEEQLSPRRRRQSRMFVRTDADADSFLMDDAPQWSEPEGGLSSVLGSPAEKQVCFVSAACTCMIICSICGIGESVRPKWVCVQRLW